MKKIVILQPNYIPWKGYFHLIKEADCFVFLDHVQYSKRDWRNRNRIKTCEGVKWITIPTISNRNSRINQVCIDNKTRWNVKHFNQIYHNYHKTPYFKDFYSFIEEVYLKENWLSLSEFNQCLIKKISRYLHIYTSFYKSSDFQLPQEKNSMLIGLVQELGGTNYVSGPKAESYLKLDQFQKAGIEVNFFKYPDYPEYPQMWKDFEHQVSILDLMFNIGPNSGDFIWNNA